MTVTVSGILRDSGGNPSPNRIIKFYTQKGFNGALPSATLEVETSETGSYGFELSVGAHLLSVQYNHTLTTVGKVTVTADMPSPINIDELLDLSEPLTPSQILQVQQLVNQAVSAANSASKDANQVAKDKSDIELIQTDVTQKAQQVSSDAGQVAQDKTAVESARQQVAANTVTVNEKAQIVVNAQSDVTEKAGQVATNTQTVNEKTTIVVDAQTDVTEKANQVSSNAGKVAQDKESVEGTAQDVATAQAVIGTSIDGVYANAAAIVSINDTILRLHPII